MPSAPPSVAPPNVSAPARRRDRDGWIALAALGVAVGCALSLDGSGRRVKAPANAPRLAVVRAVVEPVRRRSAGSLVWEELRPGDALYPADSLFVPPDATATVAFEGGSVVEVEENSLMVLPAPERDSAPRRVVLEKGAITAQAGGAGLSVAIPDGSADLAQHSAASVAVGGGAQVAVLAGSAQLHTGAGTRELPERTLGELGADGQLHTRILSARLKTPERATRAFFTTSGPQIQFSWETSEPGELTLEVARDRAFTRIVRREPANADGARLLLPGEGVYFWRLVDASGAVESETRWLVALQDVPPQPLSPRDGEHLENLVSFAWTAVPGARGYLLEVADDASFAKLELSQRVTGTQWKWQPPRSDRSYAWRVRANDPDRRGAPASTARAFDVVVTPLPDAPQLYTPEVEVERRAHP